jgi:hypothetical protein
MSGFCGLVLDWISAAEGRREQRTIISRYISWKRSSSSSQPSCWKSSAFDLLAESRAIGILVRAGRRRGGDFLSIGGDGLASPVSVRTQMY